MKPFVRYQQVTLVCCAFFAVILIRNAWLCDDAYITMRVVDNFVNGYGLRWNVAERVQAFTHPLWMLLVTLLYYWTREVYFTLIGLSLILSLSAYAIMWRVTRSLALGLMASLLLIFSKGFIDFTSSGLETPLIYLLLALWFWALQADAIAIERRIFTGGLAVALLIFTRVDVGLLVLPAYGYVVLQAIWHKAIPWRKALRLGFLAFLPLMGWFCFALFYYGFALPNTAYAKLNTAIPLGDYLRQGTIYFITAANVDPVTVLGIAVAIGLGLRMGGLQRYLAFGLIITMLYLWRIGGDFMGTRFLAAPLFVAALLLTTVPLGRPATAFCAGCLLLLGLTNPYNPVQSAADYTGFGILPNGIADERGFYYPFLGLAQITREDFTPQWKWIEYGKEVHAKATAEGRQIVEFDTVGMYGYYAGPLVHVVDTEGLADAFVARLPARDDWRIGHFQRDLPTGYFATLESGVPQFAVAGLNEYYTRLALVTQGPLFDGARLREIVRFNWGLNERFLYTDDE